MPASDVLNDHMSPEALAGRLVLIGATASGMFGIFVTPPLRTISGARVPVNAMQTVLDGSAILPAPSGAFRTMVLPPLLMAALAMRWSTPRMALAMAVVDAVVLLLNAIGVLAVGNHWLPPLAAPVGPLVLCPLWD